VLSVTPLDDDLPPLPSDQKRDIAIPVWILSGAGLILLFLVAVMFLRRVA
jgi:hypothetical protein